MKTILSVIIPAYNAEATIEKCLDSILNQTLKGIEIIVINDCSKDNTLKILNKYQDIVIINNEKNLGPAASRNKGLACAKGEYIGFVDSDDYIREDMYELMIKEMNPKVDLVVCGRTNVTKKGNKEYISKSTETDPKRFNETTCYDCDKLFKKSIINKYHIKFPEQYRYAEDVFFITIYKYYAKEMRIIKEPLYYYVVDNSTQITNSFNENLFDIIHVLQDLIDFFSKQGKLKEYENDLLQLSAGYYQRRLSEFNRYSNLKLQRNFVKEFLKFFKKNFNEYKHVINHYKSNKNLFYRSNYLLMNVYMLYKQLRGGVK